MQNDQQLSKSLCNPAVAMYRSVTEAWDTFWYQPRDPFVLCLMRVLVGGMLFYTHLIWGLQLHEFFGQNGWNSGAVVSQIQEGWLSPSFWWYVPPEWMMTVHGVCLGILLLFWVGFATRVTSVLALVITISYAYRAHMANFGLDQINAILCLYLCLGPSGARLSVDRLIRVWNWKRRHSKSSPMPAVPPSAAANLAIRLVQLHFCVIYLYAGSSKLQGTAWWSGEAVWLAFANREYQSVDMTWTAWFPWISEIMTHTTILWEVSFAAAIWVRPLRPFVLLIGMGLHLGIGAMMGMWTFGLIMIFGHLSFWSKTAACRTVFWLPSWEKLLRVPVVTQDEGRPNVGVKKPIRKTKRMRKPDSPSPAQELPLLLCVDRSASRLVQCVNYFANRGFRCLASQESIDAHAMRRKAHPSLVVLLGAGLPDDEVVDFQREHFAQSNAKPLFMVLSDGQAERLNGSVANGPAEILAGQVNLRVLREAIQSRLNRLDDRETIKTNPLRQTSNQASVPAESEQLQISQIEVV